MKITDRHLSILTLIVSAGVLYYCWYATEQNSKILKHHENNNKLNQIK